MNAAFKKRQIEIRERGLKEGREDSAFFVLFIFVAIVLLLLVGIVIGYFIFNQGGSK